MKIQNLANSSTSPSAVAGISDNSLIDSAVALSLQEDIGSGDITAQLLPCDQYATAHIISNEVAVVCGMAWANSVFQQLDHSVNIAWQVQEGEKVNAGDLLATVTGNAKSLVTGERSALNWLQTLSGTATLVAQYVAALQGTQAQLLDTRKTIPGLRYAQKFAVTVGGGKNHRLGLYDAYLIKENHIMACGSITTAITRARQLSPTKTIEVEVENLTELQEALAAEPDMIMLDNFTLSDMQQAVALVNQRTKLEVSGNISLNNVREIALTGVDYISVGSLTKNIKAIDLSMRFVRKN